MSVKHNHRTRNIKERGKCPACDVYHNINDEFVFAPHTEIWQQEGDDLVASTNTPACDFCLDSRVVWEYPCAEFVLTEIGFGTRDNWLACERCANLIEKKQLPMLTLRSVRSWLKRHGSIKSRQMDEIGLIQQAFFDHQSGEPFRYEP